MGTASPEKILKSLPTLIIPYGLKSVLKAISHAVMVEEPSNIAEYMAFYCNELLCLRKEHPELSVQDLTALLRFMKGHCVVSSASLAPCLSDAVLDEIPYARPVQVASLPTPPTVNAEPVCSSDIAENAPIRSVSGGADGSWDSIHVPCLETEAQGTLSSVQSAVFLRGPLEKGASNESLVLIQAMRPPSKPMIIVHSDNLPDVIVFQNSDQRPCPSPAHSSVEALEQRPDGSGSQTNVGPDVVVFHKVPSVQDVTDSLNDLSSLTNENTSSEHVGETEITHLSEQDTPCAHDTSVSSGTQETIKTIQLMESFRMADEPMLKRTQAKPTTAVSIKAAIAERDRLMKKILQSIQLKKQTDISKSRITGITVSSSTGGCPGHLQKTLEANAGHAKADEALLQAVTLGLKMNSPDINLALQSSVNQVWTLHQMTTGAKQPTSNPSPSQPDSYESPKNKDQTTMSGNYSPPSKSEPSEPSQEERGQLPKPSILSHVHLINTPNYVLVNDEDAERKGNQPSDTSPNTNKETPRSGAQRNWIKQYLSIYFPVDPFSSDPECSRPLFYHVTSDQGNTACSPVIVRGINPTYAASNDLDNVRECIPSEPMCHWSIEITVKKTTGQQPPQDSSLKK
ncbi:uncharacterized protein LOC121722130 [Alosa sapidissima]|uniref:uncharacterized protein LOC121722130 n=1 Tax=Alosa sapidissima TaxID=34773 RepID=UPI001C0A4B31|nr:uncharacterized protein LOC121722130 [Alosa sapidissima]